MNKEEFILKNKIIDETILKLKKDFVGIDEQIDKVMNSVRTWYLYPNLQTRPLVVSIFGMTGTGKTALVQKIVKYLDIEKDLIYFNFAEINDMKSYDIENLFDDEISTENSNKVIVYDEFQYAATIDESGCEKDNRSGMKPFWELMDMGIIHKRLSLYEVKRMYNIINLIITINSFCKIKLDENGCWENYKECIKPFEKNDTLMSDIKNYFNFKDTNEKEELDKKTETIGTASKRNIWEEYTFEINNKFLNNNTIVAILDYKYKGIEYNRYEYIRECEELSSICDIDELILKLSDIYQNKLKGYDYDVSQSIIFVIGNIDEAYTVSYDVNPDMSPDQFHKITKKISIIDIKEALQKRFRNEQIARLGNNYVIYYAFSKQNYYDIIKLYLNEFASQAKELSNLNIEFDKSIIDLIYKEGVFPTQGTRPIFSTIQEIIKNKLPKIAETIDEEGIINVTKVIYSFKNQHVIIGIYSNNELVKEISIKEKLQVEHLRNALKDEKQALCAVHESGHFVAYAALKNKLPEKVVSRAVDKNTNGFMMSSLNDDETNYTLNDVINEIQICLGGYVAEKIVFGEEYLTNGACSDLDSATMLASKAIREWGFGKHPYVTTYLPNISGKRSHLNGYLIKDEGKDSQEQEKIKMLIEQCYNNTLALFNKEEWKNMLKESAKYLSEKTEMSYKKMKEIYNKIPEASKYCQNDRYYRDCIDNF